MHLASRVDTLSAEGLGETDKSVASADFIASGRNSKV